MKQVRVRAVQLPGRGSRLAEPAFTDLDGLVAALLADVEFGAPYSFFGHSFGALLAYEVAAALRDAGRPLPRRLIVSAYPAPHLPRPNEGIHLLPDDRILQAVAQRHGGIPPEVLDDPQLSRLAASCLRADYRMVETYTWRPRPPLPVPIMVLGGRTDRVSEEHLAAWEQHTDAGKPAVRTFPGGHFYFREGRPAAVLRAVEAAAC
jgi:surfactin synthase thioesterase subunit